MRRGKRIRQTDLQSTHSLNRKTLCFKPTSGIAGRAAAGASPHMRQRSHGCNSTLLPVPLPAAPRHLLPDPWPWRLSAEVERGLRTPIVCNQPEKLAEGGARCQSRSSGVRGAPLAGDAAVAGRCRGSVLRSWALLRAAGAAAAPGAGCRTDSPGRPCSKRHAGRWLCCSLVNALPTCRRRRRPPFARPQYDPQVEPPKLRQSKGFSQGLQ